MNCPYCRSETDKDALVCTACSRDIAVPPTLIAERDELLRKREALRDELKRRRNDIETIIRRRKQR
jgi:hypothetical protein